VPLAATQSLTWTVVTVALRRNEDAGLYSTLFRMAEIWPMIAMGLLRLVIIIIIIIVHHHHHHHHRHHHPLSSPGSAGIMHLAEGNSGEIFLVAGALPLISAIYSR
jgi:hypothetical protein